MEASDALRIPTSAEYEADADPLVQRLANVIAALACVDGLVSPRRFEVANLVAQGIGDVLGEPSLTRVLTLRTMVSPPKPREAIAELKAEVRRLSAPDRARIMRALAALIGKDAKPSIVILAPDLAEALEVPIPDELRREGSGLLGSLGDLAGRIARGLRTEDQLIVAARQFVGDFGIIQLEQAIEVAQKSRDISPLIDMLHQSVEVVREQATAIMRAVDAQSDILDMARDLDTAADKIEQVARQRYVAIMRRSTLMVRQLRDDLNALVEDAAEEFETDFRRMAEGTKGWFGRIETADLNERSVVKNLERRYQRLARRYQDQLDLLDREISEYLDEFTCVSDEALRPLARHEFRAIAPNPRLELRLKAAADRASKRTLAAGAIGAVAAGTTIGTGILTTTAMVAAAATPVGMVVLGAVALAGVWKLFATPGERHRRDLRERALDLEKDLRATIMANLPRFEGAIDTAIARFQKPAVQDIAGPRVEAERLGEIARVHRDQAGEIVASANMRLAALLCLLPDKRDAHPTLPG